MTDTFTTTIPSQHTHVFYASLAANNYLLILK